MKDKILVMVYVPLIEKNFDIYIPTTKKIGTIKKLILSIILEQTSGIFVDDNTKHLYDKESGEILDDNLYVRDSIIENGTKIILY